MNNVVTVSWDNQSNQWWNETCSQIVEHFGLPGEKYITEINENFMSFKFKNDKDAFLCKIMLSEHLGH